MSLNSGVANADSKSKVNLNTKRIKQIDKLSEKLAKSLNKLSPEELKLVLKKVSKLNLEDADDDGFPDLMEEDEESVCDPDSDDDGIEDGDEVEDGMDPKEPDSDDDGYLDPEEVEKEGEIEVLDASNIQVLGVSFVINANTVFLSKKKGLLSIADFAVGQCVEVEGHKEGEINIADKVRKANCD
jgi:hypothetical protein